MFRFVGHLWSRKNSTFLLDLGPFTMAGQNIEALLRKIFRDSRFADRNRQKIIECLKDHDI